jgi:hypothetical protein
VAFDYVTTEVLESQSLYPRMASASLRAGGEPLKFGIDSTPPSSERLAELLRPRSGVAARPPQETTNMFALVLGHALLWIVRA